MKKLHIVIWCLFVVALAVFLRQNLQELRSFDAVGPIITVPDEEITVSIKDGEDAWLAGVSATDTKDGDVSNTLGVEKVYPVEANAHRRIRIVAFDSDNHVTRASRTVIYEDYTHPRFTLKSPLRFPVGTRMSDVLNAVRAYDCLDGDITGRIIYTEDTSFDIYTADEYPIEFEVTNSAGDRQVLPVTVSFYSQTDEQPRPKINLTENIVYIQPGDELDPYAYLSNVYYRGAEFQIVDGQGTFCVDTSDFSQEELLRFNAQEPAVNKRLFRIEDSVIRDTPGVYEITYTLMDENGNEGFVRLVVVVEQPI